MKRTICTLLSILLIAALMLAGCGEKAPAESTSPNSETPGQQTTAPETTSQEDPEIEPAKLGSTEGNVYTNSYAGFRCEFDEGWTVVPAEQLQNLPDQLSEIFADTEFADAAASITQIMDMQATNMTTGSSVNVIYTQMTPREIVAYRLMNEEQVIDTLLKNKDTLVKTFEKAGLEVKSIEKTTAEFLGETHTVCKTIASVQGVDVYIAQLLNYKLPGKFGITVTFQGLTEEDLAATMASFQQA